MVSSTRAALVGAFVASVLPFAAGQAGQWQQCGGQGHTGPTTCTAGYYCKPQNDFYWQCVPGTAPPASSSVKPSSTTAKPSSTPVSITTKSTPVSTPVSTSKVSVSASSTSGGAQCTGTFSPISAASYIAALDPGWNLGNSLDAVPNEDSWNNPLVTPEIFDDVKKQGFKSVRLPVTWAYHYAGAVNTGTGPDWTIQPAWLQRVSDVIDQITSRGLYVIVNVHHDSWIWADITKADANYAEIEQKFYRTWVQIATKLGCKSSLVSFEPINEPPANNAADGARINTFNNLFLKAINDAGFFNSQRVVTLVGGGQDSIKTSQWFVRPNSTYKNPWAIQYHYYSPYDFVFGAWGKTTWGSDADKAAMEADFANIRGNFTDVPLFIGEWDVSPVMTESAARWKYWDFLVRTAAKYNTPTVLWDNGNDNLDRKARSWRDKVAADILINAQKKVVNSLPDSTVDGSVTSQQSSAFIFHQIGTPVNDQTLPFLLNGNTFKAVKNGATTLRSGTDYSVSGSSLVFKSSYLTQFNTAEGIKANLTVSFSAGADSLIQVVQWAPPTVSPSTSKAVAGADLVVPVKFSGIHMPATVRALKADGTYLFDDWTQYLPVLQQARLTFNNHFRWDWGQESVTLTAAAVDAVVASGQSTTFLIESFPRVPGNSVNYTLTI